MKRMIAIAAIVAATCCGAASAADLGGTRVRGDVATPAATPWGGIAVTVTAGRSAMDATVDDRSSGAVTVDGATVASWAEASTMPFGGDGWAFGGELSYRHAVAPHLYAGAYIGGDFSTVRGQARESWSYTNGETADSGASKTKWNRDYAGFAGLELGREVGPALIFVRGGGAYGHFELSGDFGEDVKTKHDRYGWTVGGGVDVALGGAWSLRAEYQYVDWGSAKIYADDGASDGGNGATETYADRVNIDTTEQIVRAGLTYRFGAN